MGSVSCVLRYIGPRLLDRKMSIIEHFLPLFASFRDRWTHLCRERQ